MVSKQSRASSAAASKSTAPSKSGKPSKTASKVANANAAENVNASAASTAPAKATKGAKAAAAAAAQAQAQPQSAPALNARPPSRAAQAPRPDNSCRIEMYDKYRNECGQTPTCTIAARCGKWGVGSEYWPVTSFNPDDSMYNLYSKQFIREGKKCVQRAMWDDKENFIKPLEAKCGKVTDEQRPKVLQNASLDPAEVHARFPPRPVPPGGPQQPHPQAGGSAASCRSRCRPAAKKKATRR